MLSPMYCVGVFISCAMPAASWPTDSSFCACSSCSRKERRSVMSSNIPSKPAKAPFFHHCSYRRGDPDLASVLAVNLYFKGSNVSELLHRCPELCVPLRRHCSSPQRISKTLERLIGCSIHEDISHCLVQVQKMAFGISLKYAEKCLIEHIPVLSFCRCKRLFPFFCSLRLRPMPTMPLI